jgi:hypothetical protein
VPKNTNLAAILYLSSAHLLQTDHFLPFRIQWKSGICDLRPSHLAEYFGALPIP